MAGHVVLFAHEGCRVLRLSHRICNDEMSVSTSFADTSVLL